MEFLDFFNSPLAIAISWLCTVSSCIYAFIQKSESTKLQNELSNIQLSYNNLKLKVDGSSQNVKGQTFNQSGNNNITQGVVKGNVNIGR